MCKCIDVNHSSFIEPAFVQSDIYNCKYITTLTGERVQVTNDIETKCVSTDSNLSVPNLNHLV